MKINITDLIKPPSPEPPKEEVALFIEKANRIFVKCKMRPTALTKKVAPVFGRILFDVGDSPLNSWSAGRPCYQETEYAQALRGVLIAGSVGIGKTMIVRCMAATLNAQYLTVPALGTQFSQYGAEGFWDSVRLAERWDLFLDDLGAEKAVKSYSNALPIEELIYQRYDLWQRYGIRTHITTNLIGDQVEEKYGLRIRDRIKEMMTPVVGTGQSMRE